MFIKSIVLSNYEDCPDTDLGFYQQVVFVNKNDVKEYSLSTQLDQTISSTLEPLPYYRLSFSLKENKSGFRVHNNNNSTFVKGSFDKEIKSNASKYKHNLELLISGNNEHKKHLLNQFSIAEEYFAVLQHKSGLVEIYGFFTGLELDNYSFSEDSTLKFASIYSDNYMPLIYESDNPNEDFNNNFKNKELLGDFNTDFNTDYLIEGK